MLDVRQLEAAIWSIADGRSSDDDLALFHADERASLVVLDRLIDRRRGRPRRRCATLPGDERDVRSSPTSPTRSTACWRRPLDPRGRAAAGSRADREDVDDELERRVGPYPRDARARGGQAAGVVGRRPGRRVGRRPRARHRNRTTSCRPARRRSAGRRSVGSSTRASRFPGGDARRRAGDPGEGRARLARRRRRRPRSRRRRRRACCGSATSRSKAFAWRLAGRSCRALRVPQRRPRAGSIDAAVRWLPALVDSPAIVALAAAMPGTVAALGGGDGRATTTAVITAVVEAIVDRERRAHGAAGGAAERQHGDRFRRHGDRPHGRLAVPGTRPCSRANVSRTLDQWTRTVTSPSRPQARRAARRARTPAGCGSCRCSRPPAKGELVPIDAALRTDRGGRHVAAEWARLARLLPGARPCRRAPPRSGRAEPGRGVGVHDRRRARRSRRRVRRAGADAVAAQGRRPSLRLFAETPAGSVVGAHQLSNVAWSVLFDDVELTAAEVAKLARQARPLVQSRGRWVEVDRVDLEQAAAALAERESVTQLTGAEILRHSIGLDGSGLARRRRGRRRQLGERHRRAAPATASTAPVTEPEGLRRRAAHLPGRGAGVDRVPRRGRARRLPGARHGPRQDADRARPPRAHRGRRHRARHRPGGGRRQLGGRGRPLRARAARRRAPRRVAFVGDAARTPRSPSADIVITTYATAVRDIEALAAVDVEPRSCSTRRRPSRTRRARPPSSCAASRRAPASRSPARRSRTGSATCGRSSTSPTPASSARGRRSSPRCPATARPRCGRSTGSCCSAARRASPRSPPSCPTRSTSSTTAR